MTPADRELVTRIRAALVGRWFLVGVSGIDGAGKSTLVHALARALHLGTTVHPHRESVARCLLHGMPPGVAQAAAMQYGDISGKRIMDRTPLCVAAIHPEMEGWGWLYAHEIGVLTLLLDLPLAEARARKPDPEAELRDRDREAARYRELATRWPRTVILDASQPPGEVLSAALAAVARAVGVAT